MFTFGEISLTALTLVGNLMEERGNQSVARCIWNLFNHEATEGEINKWLEEYQDVILTLGILYLLTVKQTWGERCN